MVLYPISVEKATLSKPCHDREECFHAPKVAVSRKPEGRMGKALSRLLLIIPHCNGCNSQVIIIFA